MRWQRGFAPLCGAGTLALALALAAAAGAGASSIQIKLPSRVFEGQRIGIEAVRVPKGAQCRLVIRYAGGRIQRLQDQMAGDGHIVWTVRVPAVPEGRAVARVVCDRGGSASASMFVRLALQAPKITIEKSGFTQRPKRYSQGSDVSYGLVIRNERTQVDATSVTLLVNFVDATNRVLGSAHDRISRLPASSTIFFGGQAGIPVKDEVARLEVIIGATSEEREPATPLLISDIVITPRSTEPYVDAVRGQLLNQRATPMRSGLVGVIILDAEENIIGGGAGYASGPLALGAREAFNVSGDFSAIPMERAAAALVTVVPSYDD
jgi:hypothetical protein